MAMTEHVTWSTKENARLHRTYCGLHDKCGEWMHSGPEGFAKEFSMARERHVVAVVAVERGLARAG